MEDMPELWGPEILVVGPLGNIHLDHDFAREAVEAARHAADNAIPDSPFHELANTAMDHSIQMAADARDMADSMGSMASERAMESARDLATQATDGATRASADARNAPVDAGARRPRDSSAPPRHQNRTPDEDDTEEAGVDPDRPIKVGTPDPRLRPGLYKCDNAGNCTRAPNQEPSSADDTGDYMHLDGLYWRSVEVRDRALPDRGHVAEPDAGSSATERPPTQPLVVDHEVDDNGLLTTRTTTSSTLSDGTVTTSQTSSSEAREGSLDTGVVTIANRPDGSVTTTIVEPDGTKTLRETGPGGETLEITTSPDGIVTTTKTDAEGNVARL